jgi:putative DNA primase/helicase
MMMHNTAHDFITAMQLAGLSPPPHLEPDKLVRFAGVGKGKANKAAWCKLFADGSGGVYGDYSTGLSTSWHAPRNAPLQPLTTLQRDNFMQKLKQQIAAAKATTAAQETAKHRQAAKMAAKIWHKAKPAPVNHPYLVRKGITPHGTRIHKGALLIPVREGNTLHSLQFIDGEGTKRFLTGGRKRGCYYSIGNAGIATGTSIGVDEATTTGTIPLCIAEGFATGASIYQSTGYAVAVAFDAGNLEAVAISLRAKFPHIPIILCADDDPVGKSHATQAAHAIDGRVAVPKFAKVVL